MAEPIGALRVDVAANVAQIQEDLGKVKAIVNSASNEMMRGMESFAKGASAAIGQIFNLRNAYATLAATALVAFIEKAVTAGDEIVKTAQKIGISTDALQELRYAAAASGVGAQALDMALSTLSKNLGDTSGEVTEAQKALGKLGLSIKDLKGLDPAAAFALISDRMSKLTDTSQKANIANALFGRSFRELQPLLALGSSGLAKFANEARKLGIVIDSDTLAKAESAKDEFSKMGMALQAAGVNISVGFLPALKELRSVITSPDFQNGVKELAANFSEFVKFMVDNKATILTIALGFQGMRMGAAAGGAIGGKRGALIGGIGGALGGGLAGSFLADNGKDTQDAIKSITAEIAMLNSELKTTSEQILATNDPTIIGQLATKADQLKEKIAADKAQLDALKNAAQSGQGEAPLKINVPNQNTSVVMPEATKAIEDLAFKTRILNQDFIGLADGFPELAHGLKIFGTEVYGDFSKAVTSVDQLPKPLQDLNRAMLALKGAQLTQEMLTPEQKLAQELEKVNQLLAAGTISQDTYNRKVAELKFPNLSRFIDDAGNLNHQLDTASVDITNGISQSLLDFAMHSKTAQEAFRDMALGIIQSILKMIIQMEVAYPIALALHNVLGAFGGGVGSSATSIMSGFTMPKGLAGGGDFKAGSWHIVGERGPELARFGASGSVIPNHELRDVMSGGINGLTVHSNIIVQGSADKSTLAMMRAELDKRDRELPTKIVKTVQTARSRRVLP